MGCSLVERVFRRALTRRTRTAAVLTGLALLPAGLWAEDDPAVDAMLETFEFSPYRDGNIFPEQIPRADWGGYLVVDTRREAEFDQAHIPGAIHMEWREVLARRAELPADRPLLLYCNTGSLSAQAAFALRVAGREQVYVLNGGIVAWRAKGGLDAHERVRRSDP